MGDGATFVGIDDVILGDGATVVGTAEDKFLFFHLARANAAPTKAATAPTIPEITSTIFHGSVSGVVTEELVEIGLVVG